MQGKTNKRRLVAGSSIHELPGNLDGYCWGNAYWVFLDGTNVAVESQYRKFIEGASNILHVEDDSDVIELNLNNGNVIFDNFVMEAEQQFDESKLEMDLAMAATDIDSTEDDLATDTDHDGFHLLSWHSKQWAENRGQATRETGIWYGIHGDGADQK